MKKIYAFLIIVAAMATSSCNDSKKSETVETADKPKTACDCIKRMTKVAKGLDKEDVTNISRNDLDSNIFKETFKDNDCKRILEEFEKNNLNIEDFKKDCPAISEYISVREDIKQMRNSSQPESDMQNEDAGFEGESGDMEMPEDMEMPDMPEPEMPEDF
jgi:hypothetical protein